MVQQYIILGNKATKKKRNKKGHRQLLLANCVHGAAGAYPYYRRAIGRWAADSMKESKKDENETKIKWKEKENVTPEKGNVASANKTKTKNRRIQGRTTCCGLSTVTSEPARARLLWAILSLVLPVTCGHTTACRSLPLQTNKKLEEEAIFPLLRSGEYSTWDSPRPGQPYSTP